MASFYSTTLRLKESTGPVPWAPVQLPKATNKFDAPTKKLRAPNIPHLGLLVRINMGDPYGTVIS
jgi:hypothetical protein